MRIILKPALNKAMWKMQHTWPDCCPPPGSSPAHQTGCDTAANGCDRRAPGVSNTPGWGWGGGGSHASELWEMGHNTTHMGKRKLG